MPKKHIIPISTFLKKNKDTKLLRGYIIKFRKE